MLTPPPSLTPMERQFLLRLQDLDQTLCARMATQDKKIATLEAQVERRDRSVAALTELLESLLGPVGPDGSSLP